MVLMKCLVCRVFIHKKPYRVGEEHFWKHFRDFMSHKHGGKPYNKSQHVCGKCHIQIRKTTHQIVSHVSANTAETSSNSEQTTTNRTTEPEESEEVLVNGLELGVTSDALDSFSDEGLVNQPKSETEKTIIDAQKIIADALKIISATDATTANAGNVYAAAGQMIRDAGKMIRDTGNVLISAEQIENFEGESHADTVDSEVVNISEELDSFTLNCDREDQSSYQNEVMDMADVESLGIELSENSHEVVLSVNGTQCSESSEVSEASTIYLLKNINAVGSSERRCTVCQSTHGRSRIPKKALWQVWVEKQILIPVGNRTCSTHMRNSRFTPEAIAMIEASRIGVQMSGKELGDWMLGVTGELGCKKPMRFVMDGTADASMYKMFFGISKGDFEDLYDENVKNSEMRNSACRHKKEALAMLLIMLRKNLDQETIGFLFGCTQSVVSDSIDAMTTLLTTTFVPKHLGYAALPREEAIRRNSRSILSDVIGLKDDELAIIADGTYLYVEQPLDMKTQRLLYSGHKGRSLVKVMVLVDPSGRILNLGGPYGANGTNNDASIMQHMLLDTDLANYLQENDKLIVDRGFRNVEGELQEQGYEVFMPAMLRKDQTQFDTLQANQTRLITKNRWVVESVNGRLKNVFKFFKHMIEGTYVPKIMKFVQIACALFNRYFKDIQAEKPDHKRMASEMLRRVAVGNELQKEICDKELEGRLLVANWRKASLSVDVLDDFPKLTMKELEDFLFGEYQLRVGSRYVHQHMDPTGDFEFFVYKQEDLVGTVLAFKIQSRFRSCVKHQLWIRYDAAKVGIDAITGHYCKCQVGSRTVGSCSHIAGVLRYLSHDRHQPAQASRSRAPLGIIDAKARVNEIRELQRQDREMREDSNE